MKNNIIHIDLDNNDEFFNKYDNNKINEDLEHYIIEEALKFDKKKILIIVSANYNIDDKEKNKIKKILRKSFEDNIKKITSMNRDFMRDMFLVLIGISCIIISLMFNYLSINIMSELFLIIGWVPIWEFAYNMLFIETHEIEMKRKYKQLLNSIIRVK